MVVEEFGLEEEEEELGLERNEDVLLPNTRKDDGTKKSDGP